MFYNNLFINFTRRDIINLLRFVNNVFDINMPTQVVRPLVLYVKQLPVHENREYRIC